MLHTIIASILIVLLGWGTTSWLTYDFQVWTDEGARRLEVALQPIDAPPVLIEGPDLAETELSALLRQKNKVTIVDFFYTRCQTVCLSLGSIFQQMQAALLNDESNDEHTGNIRLLSISFDREHDDLPALKTYADNLSARPELWRFARVLQAEQEQVLLQQLGVVVIPDGHGDYEHNAALLVFDGAGRMVRIFDIEEYQLALDYARHLARKQIQEASL